MDLTTVRHFLWPEHEFLPTRNLPEHLVPPTRMRNRWRLDRLVPYIRRWLGLALVFAVLAGIGKDLPHGAAGFSLYVIGIFCMVPSLAVAAFWCILYSLRPR